MANRAASDSPFPFEDLSRWPDPIRDNLFAADATDRLLIDLAAADIRNAPAGTVVTVGDRYGALTLACVHLGATGIRCHQDSYSGWKALEANAASLGGRFAENLGEVRAEALTPAAFQDARVVLMQLPKSLEQLAHQSALIAKYADASVKVFAGGRIKHMNQSMNAELGKYFARVQASLARQKSRALIASEPKDAVRVPEVPSLYYDSDLDMTVASYPGVFAAGRVDPGARFLCEVIAREAQTLPQSTGARAPLAVDLGSGAGVLGVALLRARPDYQLYATDSSAVAVQSTEQTLQRNCSTAEFEVYWDHAASDLPQGTADLVLCNPPFHAAASISTELSELMIRAAGRILRPGGQMLTVFNSHLPHRSSLSKMVGPTEQLARNPKFTVTRSVRSDA